MVGRSACMWMMILLRRCGSMTSSASKMRSDPETWSARVITARPSAFSTQAAITSESVATTTSPTRAACARRMTWTIIGWPAMSRSGLPGSRVEAMRAGMRMRASAIDPTRRAAQCARGDAFERRCSFVPLIPSYEKSRGCDFWPWAPLARGRAGNGRLYGLPGPRQTGYLCAAAIRGCLPLSHHAARASFEAMDSFEVNKILGAFLGTCLCLLAINIAAGAIFAPEKPAKPGYDVAVPEQTPSGKRAEQEKQQPIEQLLANADVKRGENSAKKCQACHTFNKGGRNLVGPNLWGVVGRARASEAGFNYSAAMKGKGGNWTIDDLNQFITNPRGFIPGTNMTFAGIPRGSERADVITYLNSLADNPAPLPKAAEAGDGAKPQ